MPTALTKARRPSASTTRSALPGENHLAGSAPRPRLTRAGPDAGANDGWDLVPLHARNPHRRGRRADDRRVGRRGHVASVEDSCASDKARAMARVPVDAVVGQASRCLLATVKSRKLRAGGDGSSRCASSRGSRARCRARTGPSAQAWEDLWSRTAEPGRAGRSGFLGQLAEANVPALSQAVGARRPRGRRAR